MSQVLYTHEAGTPPLSYILGPYLLVRLGMHSLAVGFRVLLDSLCRPGCPGIHHDPPQSSKQWELEA